MNSARLVSQDIDLNELNLSDDEWWQLDQDSFLHSQYLITTPTEMQKLRFGMTLFGDELMMVVGKLNKWDAIIPDKLYIGKIPTKEEAKQIKQQINPALVVVLVEDFEKQGNARPLTRNIQEPYAWANMNIRCHCIPVTDFTVKISIPDLYETLQKIHEEIIQGNSVYVHCKAGRGRSAMVCYFYLYLYGSEGELAAKASFAEIHALLQKKRKQIGLDKTAMEIIRVRLEKYINDLASEKHISVVEKQNDSHLTIADFDEYLASIQAKKAICQLPAFQALKIYALDKIKKHVNDGNKSKRANCIKEFFQTIYSATDGKWMVDLLQAQGPLKDLVDVRPWLDVVKMEWIYNRLNLGKPKQRERMVNGLQDELTHLLLSELHCSKEQLSSHINSYANQHHSALGQN